MAAFKVVDVEQVSAIFASTIGDFYSCHAVGMSAIWVHL